MFFAHTNHCRLWLWQAANPTDGLAPAAKHAGVWESSLVALASQHNAAKPQAAEGTWDVRAVGSINALLATALLQGSGAENSGSGTPGKDTLLPRGYALSLAAVGSRDAVLQQLRSYSVEVHRWSRDRSGQEHEIMAL